MTEERFARIVENLANVAYLTLPTEGQRIALGVFVRSLWNEAVEECAKVCDEGVKWEPNFPSNIERVSDETCRLLAKANRSLKIEEPK